jgi:hypothetical protein
VTCHPYLLEIEGPFTQGWRPGRTVGESVGGILEMDSSDWSNGIRYHTIDTRPDTEFRVEGVAPRSPYTKDQAFPPWSITFGHYWLRQRRGGTDGDRSTQRGAAGGVQESHGEALQVDP